MATNIETERLKEIFRLYDISEAEEHLIFKLVALVQLLGLSKKLTVKLLQATAALLEAFITDEDKKESN